MPLDTVIVQIKRFVPVRGPTLVHDLGADLGLEKQRGLADHLDDHQHPLILFPAQHLGVLHDELQQVAGLGPLFILVFLEQAGEFRVAAIDAQEKGLLAHGRIVRHALVVALQLLDIIADIDFEDILQVNVEIVIDPCRDAGVGCGEEVRQEAVIAHQVVDAPGELDHIIHPTPPFGAQLGDGPLVRERFAVEVVIPGMAEVEVVLEEIDVGQHMIEDHHVEPVRVVVVVKGDRRTGIDHRFIGVARIELVFALLLEDLHIVHPVVVERGNHHLGRELDQVAVGNDVLQALVLEAQAGIAGSGLATLHDGFRMLIDQFHGTARLGCGSQEISRLMPSMSLGSSTLSLITSRRRCAGCASRMPDFLR